MISDSRKKATVRAASGKDVARLRLRLTPAAQRAVRDGHPWIFSDSVREQNRDGCAGELAVVYGRSDRFLAVGLFDPVSPIRVRILHRGKPQTIDNNWWAQRLTAAIERRRGLFDERTTGYRWINGESDGWPGLVLDRYTDTVALKLYTAAWLPRLDNLLGLIVGQLRPARIVLRLSRNIQAKAEAEFGRIDGQVIHGPALEESIVFLESGLRFEADVLRGQKTGFFLDQRENRRQVEALAGGRRMLNAFSFSGGFSLYAARGGAKSVTDLDISPHALSAAERNFNLNRDDPRVATGRREAIQADAFDWLEKGTERKFDLIVLDPPSLAKREAERAGAIRAYAKLARLGIDRLATGGILLAASCSAHVTAEEFFDSVRLAARKSNRRFVELQTTRHAPDHPATFKEADYLKAIYLRFDSAPARTLKRGC